MEELVHEAKSSAARLVNILARDFRCFRDESPFEGRRKPVRFLKRAQIFVADVWACFDGEGYGSFRDIDKITMFADYRVPQILNSMGALYYSPKLVSAITRKEQLKSGGYLELQLRGKASRTYWVGGLRAEANALTGCSIWCVELIRREILKNNPGARVNAILIDYFLYDTMKEREKAGMEGVMTHHRTRSIWY